MLHTVLPGVVVGVMHPLTVFVLVSVLLCSGLGLVGRMRIAHEGINGLLCGTSAQLALVPALTRCRSLTQPVKIPPTQHQLHLLPVGITLAPSRL